MYTNRKTLLLKCVLIAFLVYVCAYMILNSYESIEMIKELQLPSANVAVTVDSLTLTDDLKDSLNTNAQSILNMSPSSSMLPSSSASLSSALSSSSSSTTPSTTVEDVHYLDVVKQILQCNDKPLVPARHMRGDYWVLYNFVIAERQFKCHESVTYTTHADYSFLDNLVPLLHRWRGPISIALHAPGSDFSNTFDAIAYLRDCTGESSHLVRELVTFHIYFSTHHIPQQLPAITDNFSTSYNCTLPAPYLNVSTATMYKAKNKLLYPVNVGRNVARVMAQTHYVLPSDIELYPSLNLIPQFLTMIANNGTALRTSKPKVFPLNLFEVSASAQVPANKTVLQAMLANRTAVPFHKKLCPMCHNVPKADLWQKTKETDKLDVFFVGKRNGTYFHWEPIFIGTNSEPFYDERLSWEGRSDKMTQGYALCVYDYEFQILNNAFLVHRPGIKHYVKDKLRERQTTQTNQLIKKKILPELKIVYGVRKGCAV